MATNAELFESILAGMAIVQEKISGSGNNFAYDLLQDVDDLVWELVNGL